MTEKRNSKRSNTNETRDAILRQLYDVLQNARSPRKAGVGIRDLQRLMKSSAGYTQQEVASNLHYLIQKEWVTEIVEDRTFKTARGTTQQAERVTYVISDLGIDMLEGGATMYQRPDAASHINITNIRGVTVVGEGNVVNIRFADLSQALGELRSSILEAGELTDDDKLSVVADIDTLQVQLQKPEPDKTIVQRAWQGIQTSVTAAGFVELLDKAGNLIGPLLS